MNYIHIGQFYGIIPYIAIWTSSPKLLKLIKKHGNVAWDHQKWLKHQIIGGNTVKKIQTDPKHNGDMAEKENVPRDQMWHLSNYIEAELLIIAKRRGWGEIKWLNESYLWD